MEEKSTKEKIMIVWGVVAPVAMAAYDGYRYAEYGSTYFGTFYLSLATAAYWFVYWHYFVWNPEQGEEIE